MPFSVGKNHDIVLFADDNSLIFKIKRRQNIYDDVNNTLSKVVHTTPNTKIVKADVLLNGEAVDPVDFTLFLGIIIDSKLHWGPHIYGLANKLSAAAFAVKKIRRLIDVHVMSYGILLWGNAAGTKSIFVLQKRAIRAIYNLGLKEL